MKDDMSKKGLNTKMTTDGREWRSKKVVPISPSAG